MGNIMKRTFIAFIVGLFTWIVVISLIDRMLRVSLAGYAAAEPGLTFTVGMMAARLSMAAVTSLIAGAAVGLVARADKRAPWILGAVLLIVFIPVHISIWHALPVWYHLTFLVPLAPLIVLGAWLTNLKSTNTAPGQVATSP
jgi:hypothetical protein